MSIRNALQQLFAAYPNIRQEDFTGNPVASYIRQDMPKIIREAAYLDDRYKVVGSAGQGGWAVIPWVAVFDRFITETAQEGYYIVYLLKEDGSGIYLSLNQGVTALKRQYKTDAINALRAKANDYLARLGDLKNDRLTQTIQLSDSPQSKLGSLYEAGNIAALYYSRESIPNESTLLADLNFFLAQYKLLSQQDLTLPSTQHEADEEALLYEDLTKLREHKRIERNKKLAEKAKKIHGYKCQACGFDFEKVYGEIGRGFIEAHHKTPITQLTGYRIPLDPEKDFSVLCSNCHRMIHRTELVSHIEDFRAKYILKRAK